MNLGEASIVLRHRPGLEVVDLALRFVRSVAPKQFLKLSALLLLPAFLLSLALRAGDLPWTAVWFVALILSKVLELPFTTLCGRLLFEPTAPLRQILGESARALGRTLVAYALYGLFLFASLLLVVGPLFVGASYFFLPEVLALEKSGPFRAFKRSHQFLGGRSGTGLEGLMLSLGLVLSFIFFAEILGQATLEYVLVVHLPIESLWEDGGSPLALLGLFAATPYVATHRFLAYTNERTRQDGWDIQVAFLRLAAKPRSTVPLRSEHAA
jgi:hypothetical protein